MKRAILQCLLTALLAIPVHAAQPPPEGQPKSPPPPPARVANEAAASEAAPAEVTEPVIPTRELVFEQQSEPLKMDLFAADPEVLKLRFGVIVQLDAEGVVRPTKWGLPSDLDRLKSSLQRSQEVPTSLLRSFTQETPKDRLPSHDLVEALTVRTPLYMRDYRRSVGLVRDASKPGGSNIDATISFRVLAPTSERAKELTRAVLTLFDYGFSYPVQRHWLLMKQERLKDLPTKRVSLSQVEEELRRCEEELEAFAEYEDVSAEALNGLITQQRLISVDLSGVRARIGACTKILADRANVSENQVDQVELIKITAEIELVGLEAQESSIDQIVEKAGQRRKLSDEFAAVQKKVTLAERDIGRSQDHIEGYESARKQFMPLPIKGGVLPIHPIQWKPAREENP